MSLTKGKCRSQDGCGRDHLLDRDRLLPSDLERAGLAGVGLAFLVFGKQELNRSAPE